MKLFIGVDGGLSGGISIINGDGVLLDCFVMPVIKNGKGREYDLKQISSIFEAYKIKFANMTVVLEKAHTMPLNGGRANFTTGECFGMVKGVLSALRIPFEVIAARTWQKKIFQGQTVKDTKQSSILFCRNKFPDVDWRASDRCRKDHDGKTDATCLAVYGLRHLK